MTQPVEDRKSLFLRAARCQTVERVPVWMMRQAGRYLPEYRELRARHSFLGVCKTPDLAAEVSLQPFRTLGVDAVIVFSDILIPAEAMGMPLEIGDGGPVLAKPVRSATEVAQLRDFDPERETRFMPDAIRLLTRQLGPSVPVLGFAAAPWTLACYMVEGRSNDGFPAAKQFAYQQPDAFRSLLNVIARNTAEYLRAQVAAGAAAVQIFDTWAGELNRSEYERIALPPLQEMIAGVKAAGAPVIFYSKATTHLLPLFARLSADVIGLDWRVDLAEARAVFGERVALQGNIDPCVLLGPAEAVRRAAHEAVAKTQGRGHILNLGHGILPNTPVENARAFIEAGQAARLVPSPIAAGE